MKEMEDYELHYLEMTMSDVLSLLWKGLLTNQV